MQRAERICRLLFAAALAAAVLYGAGNTVAILRAGASTSFPWYAAWYFAAVYFGPALAVLAAAWGMLHWYNKKKEGNL